MLVTLGKPLRKYPEDRSCSHRLRDVDRLVRNGQAGDGAQIIQHVAGGRGRGGGARGRHLRGGQLGRGRVGQRGVPPGGGAADVASDGGAATPASMRSNAMLLFTIAVDKCMACCGCTEFRSIAQPWREGRLQYLAALPDTSFI